MKLTKDDIPLFCERFNIYRKAYNKNQDGTWIKIGRYLTDNVLLRSINKEESDIGYFSCYMTNFFAIDIDDHNGVGCIERDYRDVVSKLGTPSLISKSPRGLHVYYSIKELKSADLIVELLGEKFAGKHYEFKPTSDLALRTINADNLLDENLHKLDLPFREILENSIVYNFSELFYEERKNTLQSKKINSIKKQSSINNGETNEAIKNLIPVWKQQGYTIDECVRKFQSLLSPNYKGDCLKFEHVQKRVKSFFKNDILWTQKKADTVAIETKYNSLISTAIELHRKKHKKILPRQEEIIKNIIVASLQKKESCFELYSNARSKAYMGSKYKYFNYEVSRGNTPLPSKLFASIAKNYHKSLNFLISIGFLERKNGRSYDSNRGSCQYYYINDTYHMQYSQFAYQKLYDSNQINSLVHSSFKERFSFVHEEGIIIKLLTIWFLFNLYICYNMFILFFMKNEKSYVAGRLIYDG